MNRGAMLRRVAERRGPWDLLIVGGGATGVGVAVDAASRGYDVLLIEGDDFGKGTSSRSTKLVHGGVRYLGQGNVSLVMEALRERGRLRQNAPHLVHASAFVVPCYRRRDLAFYGLGLKVYHALSGRYRFGPSRILSRAETVARLPTVRAEGLRGGVLYHDGQFDDARLLINLVATAAGQGAVVLNYARVTGLTRNASGAVDGVRALDLEGGAAFEARARAVINATGAFSDGLRRMADPQAEATIAPSQGAHLVFDRSFLPGEDAIMVPRTSDGRVLFAIPWEGRTLIGTTDVPIGAPPVEPVATEAEIAFILETASGYLRPAPTRGDIRSVFAGIRPLVKAGKGGTTASLARDHTIRVDGTGLISIAGGKWTTYRSMAEDCVDRAGAMAGLPARPSRTESLAIHGSDEDAGRYGDLAAYGSDAPAILDLIRAEPALGDRLDPALATVGAEVVWAARCEMARTVEDALARRSRALFLDARAAIAMAPRVAELMADELGRDEGWRSAQVASFTALARGYLPA